MRQYFYYSYLLFTSLLSIPTFCQMKEIKFDKPFNISNSDSKISNSLTNKQVLENQLTGGIII